MAPRNETFGQALIGLWFSLSTVCAAALFLALAFFLFPGKVIGWLYYLTLPEMAYEVTVCVIFLALLALIMGGVALVSVGTAPQTAARQARADAGAAGTRQ